MGCAEDVGKNGSPPELELGSRLAEVTPEAT